MIITALVALNIIVFLCVCKIVAESEIIKGKTEEIKKMRKQLDAILGNSNEKS